MSERESCCAFELSFWQATLLKTVVVLSVIPAAAIILGYVFLLKMMAHMQSRLGPMEPGGFHGWFQLIGDGIKFIQKEDIIPAEADRRVFAIAPVVVLVSTFLLYIVLPAGPDLVVQDLDVGIFYALAVSSLSVIGVLMAGWASANKYSLLGSLRAAGQLIAYELPLVLAVVGVVIQAGHHEPAGHRARPGRRGDLRDRPHRQPVHPHPGPRLRDLRGRVPGRAHPDALRHAGGRVRAGGRAT